jgi:hypothetical protein
MELRWLVNVFWEEGIYFACGHTGLRRGHPSNPSTPYFLYYIATPVLFLASIILSLFSF